MFYSFWDKLTGAKLIARGKKAPRCRECRATAEIRHGPWLYLLPVLHDKSYTPSGDYYCRMCRPLDRVEDIPTGQRACRMWTLVCPVCGKRSVLVVDFLRVRGEEVTEEYGVYDARELAPLLMDTRPESGPAPGVQSFQHREARVDRY